MNIRQHLILALSVLAGYVFLLAVFPYWFPPDPALPNVAAQLGYNIGVAYNAAVLWTFVSLAGIAWYFRRWRPASPEQLTSPNVTADQNKFSPGWLRLEIIVVFVVFFVAYFPSFLARYGDFIEDKYFLSVLSRMSCGQAPYGDFEFLYGPLMVYPAHYWVSVFGLSFSSYYAFLALLQGSLFATLMATLQRYLPEWKMRYLVFLLLVPPLFDVILGLNYIGWRRILPVFAIMIIAARPLDIRAIVAAAVLLGVEIAYSLEYGLSGLAACGAIYAALLAPAGDRMRVAQFGAGLAIGAVSCGLAFMALTTGSGFGEYLSATLHVLAEASSKGLGAFRFYWTVHSLSLFALFALSLVAIGAGFGALFKERSSEGDRLLIGAVVFAVISLKVAFQRADIWHMASPFLALTIAYLVSPTMRVIVIPAQVRRIGLGLIAIASISTAIGYLPMGMYYGSGLLRGAVDVITGVEAGGPIISRRPSVLEESTSPNEGLVQLAAYLAAPERKDRPVMFYKDRWATNHKLGVCPIGYTFYDLMYSDARAPLKDTLEANPQAYVIMDHGTYRRLFGLAEYEPWIRVLKKREKLGVYFATVHYFQSPLENEIEYKMWKDSLGDYLVAEFELTAQFGSTAVLSRRHSSSTIEGGASK